MCDAKKGVQNHEHVSVFACLLSMCVCVKRVLNKSKRERVLYVWMRARERVCVYAFLFD